MSQDMKNPSLKLIAESQQDLAVIAASLQDAIVKVSDIVVDKDAKTLTVRAFRFMHEGAADKRVVCALRFNHVLGVQTKGINRADPDAFLVLLTIDFKKNKGRSSAGVAELVFAGGGSLKAEAEYIEARLVDLGPPQDARATPLHPSSG